MKTRFPAACLFVLLFGVGGIAYGQSAASSFPSKPITIIVPFPPGSSLDADARVWGLKMQESLGKPYIVDFKPGAGGSIGTNFVVKSPADGHTLLIASNGFSTNAATRDNLPYDPLKDFTPISLVNKRITVLMVHPDVPVKTFREYVALVKKSPGELNMGTNGAGGITHMMGAWLHSAAGIKVTFVHYKGTAPMLQDLIAGRVQVTSGSVFTSSAFIKQGRLRPIALLGKERSSLMPGMATAAEQGVPDYDYAAWTGFLGPAGMPSAIVDKLYSAMAKYAKTPEMTSLLEKDGTLVSVSTPEEFKKFLLAEITGMRRVAQEFNIKAAED